mmetsp:Transcript_15996/g.37715  ORF Transcript_15996/g.37715 Transcript_15996/m.37715 type:complete len:131 (+) Transcript_15996:81-473(+)|eukprot:CAMPEP_0178430716 /NCGR_PEP_ID=MMETSP0689_2-20121128/31465_1 /TAXON_ID=160604 /ORGANISM="Amphidinium massartii, Strain CS-259" /LENGTH=130 /DNA_ID=CAMNT_0020052585 /DNA_START=81 /DNA_END=473 /DNA_ORIENTATION=-
MAKMAAAFVGFAVALATLQGALADSHMETIRCINATHHAHMHEHDHSHSHGNMSDGMDMHDDDWMVMENTAEMDPCNSTNCENVVCDATSCTPETCEIPTADTAIGSGAWHSAGLASAVVTAALAFFKLA